MNGALDTPEGDTALHATDGSALYYALLYVDSAASTRVIETLHFIQTLSSTLNDVTEGQVAEKKIHWWHEELARMSKQQSRHPSCIAVHGYLSDNKSIEASLAILSATANERYAPATTEQVLNDMIRADYGARLTLIDNAMKPAKHANARTDSIGGDKPISFQKKSEIMHSSTTSPTNKNDAIALGLGHFDRLQSLPTRLRCGYPVFSDQRYTEFGLTPEDFLSYAKPNSSIAPDTQDKVRALLSCTVADAHTATQKAIDCLVEQRRTEPTNLPVHILCQVRCAQLKLWKKRKPNLLNETVTLTPLRKFFIAYRCKRRFEQT